MCGRDTFKATWREVRECARPLQVTTPHIDAEPAYNRAPTDIGHVIVASADGGTILPMRWGLLPPWQKDPRLAYRTINARIESCIDKPAFRAAWQHRRCLVPSSGYYEWQPAASGRQPWYIHTRDAPVMFLAGLWEARPDGAGGELLTYSVITRGAAAAVSDIHDRMPQVLPAADFDRWLHGPVEAAMDLLRSAPEPDLAMHPVEAAVGNVRNQGAQLIEPIALPHPPLFGPSGLQRPG